MLVLTRNIDEVVRISIGGVDVAVTVVDVQGLGVRLGFQAPKDVRIDRQEVYLRRMEASGRMDSRC